MKTCVGVVGIAALLSGCATSGVWKATNESTVTIDKVSVVCSTDYSGDIFADVYGRRESPIVPGVIETTITGVVDKLIVAGTEMKLAVCLDGFQSDFNAEIGMDMVPWQDFIASSNESGQRVLHLHYAGGFLVADLEKWRSYLVIPIHRESLESGKELWTVKVLDKPWVPYSERFYHAECGMGPRIAQRIAFVPFALAVDILTLPLQVICGLFTHM